MIDQDIKKFVLRRLLQKRGDTASTEELKFAIRSAFPVAFMDGELDTLIRELEDSNLIAGAHDDFGATIWALTPKGTIRAQALNKIS